MTENTNEKIEHTFKDENDARSALTEADVKRTVGYHRRFEEQLRRAVEHRRRGRWRRERKAEEGRTEVERVCFEFKKMDEVEDVEVRVGDLVVLLTQWMEREFIEERYQNCQCLIGIAHKGRAVVGVVGIPFPKGKITKESDVEAWRSCTECVTKTRMAKM